MPPDDTSPQSAGKSRAIGRGTLALLLLIFLAGAALRCFAPPAFKTAGHDEALYQGYVQVLDAYTPFCYPKIVEYYNRDPMTTSEAQLPPTRFLYIFCSYCWDQAFHHKDRVDGEPMKAWELRGTREAMWSLHAISCLFSILMMPLAALFAFRLGGERVTAGVLALVAFSPMQIYVSRHALIDGFFAFWAVFALWLLWENLKKPEHKGWLAAYTTSLALLILTKENAFFVFVAILGILIVNRWAKFGAVTRSLVLCTFAGGLLGVAGIAIISGGLDYAIQTYMLLVRNASHLGYAIETGDGPWYRYICELLLMSPFVLLLALGGVFRLGRENKAQIYLFCFVAFSYLVMCNVKYGMNLRYTNMWDMPLRYLAFWQLGILCEYFGRRKKLALTLSMALLCFFDLRQYDLFFVKYHIYEPVPKELLRAVKIYVP
jgi:hypothetical protein